MQWEFVRIIIFPPSKLWKVKFFVLCGAIFLVRLQGKVGIEWKCLPPTYQTPGFEKAVIDLGELYRLKNCSLVSHGHGSLPHVNPADGPKAGVVSDLTVRLVRFGSFGCWRKEQLYLVLGYPDDREAEESFIRYDWGGHDTVERCVWRHFRWSALVTM